MTRWEQFYGLGSLLAYELIFHINLTSGDSSIHCEVLEVGCGE